MKRCRGAALLMCMLMTVVAALLGMSGARIVLHLSLELQRRGGGTGAAALCGGGGRELETEIARINRIAGGQ